MDTWRNGWLEYMEQAELIRRLKILILTLATYLALC
jgi:hypothetical protein